MQHIYGPGDRGPAVAQITGLLQRLGLLQEGFSDRPDEYDEQVELAVRAFQQERGLTVDGRVGELTYRRLDEARWRLGDRILTHRPGLLMAGDDVFALQQQLLELGFRPGRADGYFGPATESGLREFQRNIGVPADGTCGPATLKALTRLSPRVRGGAPNALRAAERVRDAGPSLVGKVVVIDPARGDNLPEELHASSDAIVLDLARRIEGRLVATGVQAYLTSWGSTGSSAAERAGFANDTRAHLCISLAVDASSSTAASGAATYFFGSQNHDAWSSTGERLAGLVQREVVARTDLVDLRTHAKTWELLRRTRMPAVRLETGYLSNPRDADRLNDAGFRDVVAEAVVVAVQRFYLDPSVDPNTGALRLHELGRIRWPEQPRS